MINRQIVIRKPLTLLMHFLIGALGPGWAGAAHNAAHLRALYAARPPHAALHGRVPLRIPKVSRGCVAVLNPARCGCCDRLLRWLRQTMPTVSTTSLHGMGLQDSKLCLRMRPEKLPWQLCFENLQSPFALGY